MDVIRFILACIVLIVLYIEHRSCVKAYKQYKKKWEETPGHKAHEERMKEYWRRNF